MPRLQKDAALIEQTIPSLVNGVSRQSIQSRRDSQCEEQENILSTVAEGVIRRPPTEHVAVLSPTAYPGGAHFSIINRGDDQQFLTVITEGNIEVFDVETGLPVVVNNGTLSPTETFEIGVQYPTVVVATNTVDLSSMYPYDNTHSYPVSPTTLYGPVQLTNDLNNLPGGLATNTDYWVLAPSTTTLQFFDGPAGNIVDLTSEGTGITTITWMGGFVSGLFDLSGENLSPRDIYETVTVADYTFVVNKTQELAMSGKVDNPRAYAMECLITVQEGATSGYYNRLRLTMGSASILSDTTNGTSSDLMMDSFCNKLTATVTPFGKRGVVGPGNGEFADWIWTRVNRTTLYGHRDVEIVPPVNQAYDLDTEDLYGDTIHELLTTTVAGGEPSLLKFSDAPAEGREGFTVEIQGDEGNTGDSFYIEYNADRRSWQETVKPGINSTFNPQTFPHVLIFNQTTREFSFEVAEWGSRGAGDEVTAPEPAALGKPVKDLFIHQGRLCLLAGENVLMSEAGDYFNFWPTTVTTLIDSDALDVAGTGNRVATWDYAVPARGQVLLFSPVGNLVSALLGGNDDSISVKNARIQVLGTYAHSDLRPQTLGNDVYYTLDKGGSSAVSQLKEVEVEVWNMDEVSAHVPGYIPVGLTRATTSDPEQIMTYLSDDEPNTIYVYVAETLGGQALTSSWSRWSFATGDVILAAEWVESIMYVTIERSDGVHLEKMDFGKLDEELGAGVNPMGHRVHLDSLTRVTGVYNVQHDYTLFTLPYTVDDGVYQVIRGQEWGNDRGLNLTVDQSASTFITVGGDYSAFPVFIGREYLSLYQMSTIVKRNADGFGELAGRLQLRKGRVAYADTGAFDVVLSSTEDDEVSTVAFDPAIVGGSLLGAIELSSGTFPFHIGGKNTDVEITFQSSSFLPFKLSSVNWEGRFYKVSQ